MQKVKVTLVLDPGHGDTPGARGYDAGVTHGAKVEARSALECSLTIKSLLISTLATSHPEIDLDVHLTRDGTAGAKPDLNGRMKLAASVDADMFASVHFDMKFTPSQRRFGVYHAVGAVSKGAAERIAASVAKTGVRTWCRASTESRFGGLYIDSFRNDRPAVLLELDSIEFAPKTGAAGKQERIALCQPWVEALAAEIALIAKRKGRK